MTMTSTQARIQLSTNDATLALPARTGPILINTDVGRYGLSRLVNTLLATPNPIPLAFLVNGHFLHAPSLAHVCRAHGISTETTLAVEYVRALVPPTEHTSLEHDDWVAAVDVLSSSSGPPRILSASYDGRLRIWDASCTVLATSSVGAGDGPGVVSLTAARWMSGSRAVAAGHDMCVRVWDYAEERAKLAPAMEFYGHTAHIMNLATHAPSHRILSAAADHTARLWSTDESDAQRTAPYTLPGFAPSDRKRRKVSGSGVPALSALTTLSGHAAPVTGCAFHATDATVAYTTSIDTALKTWDLTTAACVSSIHPTGIPGAAALCLAAVPVLGSSVVAVGTTGRSAVLVDTRAAQRPAFGILRGHRAAVSCLAVEPAQEQGTIATVQEGGATPRISAAGYGIASGSHDGTVRVWDLRSLDAALVVGGGGGEEEERGLKSASAVCSIPRQGRPRSERVEGGQGVKVFGVAWDQEVGIVSCGEDGRVLVSL